MKSIALVIASLFAVSAFAAEPAKAPATPVVTAPAATSAKTAVKKEEGAVNATSPLAK
jgi:hypothetical protein